MLIVGFGSIGAACRLRRERSAEDIAAARKSSPLGV
jgi:hypothetical protein